MELTFERRSVCGTVRFYPMSAFANAFMRICGKRTLCETEIAELIAAGAVLRVTDEAPEDKDLRLRDKAR